MASALCQVGFKIWGNVSEMPLATLCASLQAEVALLPFVPKRSRKEIETRKE
jgi:arginyl-tRNA--protein-N-Asp/Glu arginylyltransferase